MYGDDKFRAVELKYGNTSKLKGFLMFSLYWCDEDGPQRILGFGLHSLIKLLRYRRLFLHIDATFDGAPRGGVLSGVDFLCYGSRKRHAYADFYCPMTKKSEEAYNLLWANIVAAVGKHAKFMFIYFLFL